MERGGEAGPSAEGGAEPTRASIVELSPREAFNAFNNDAIERDSLGAGFFAVDSGEGTAMLGCVVFRDEELQMEWNEDYAVWEYDPLSFADQEVAESGKQERARKEEVTADSFSTAVLFHGGETDGVVGAMTKVGVQRVFAVRKSDFLQHYPWWSLAGKVNALDWKLPTQVDDQVFWSGRSTVEDPACLKQLDITSVVSLATSGNNLAGVEHHRAVCIDDDAGSLAVFLAELPAVEAFIAERLQAGGRVLVHCDAGRSRSACVILAHIIRSHAVSCDEAVEKMKRMRPLVRDMKEGSLLPSFVRHIQNAQLP